MGELQSALDALAAEDLYGPVRPARCWTALADCVQARNRLDAELARTRAGA